MAPLSKSVPNLIQGISHQAPQQRRDSQCEDQLDCINSPVDGCIPRPGFDLLAMYPGLDLRGCFTYDIFRDISEHYLCVIRGGAIRVFDLSDGTQCSVATPDGTAYLAASETENDVFCAATIEDYTFIANKRIVPQMASTLSPSRPSEALLSFRAGAYSTTYSVKVTYGGTDHNFTYTTPDNSVSGNAAYIATNQLASTLFGALDDLDALGFSRAVTGSVVMLYRLDGAPFQVSVSDGVGGTHLKAALGTVQSFSDLPKAAFHGFTVRVRGDSKTGADDYYVRFNGSGETGGYWEETIAPNTRTSFDAATMPWRLVNTGYRTFTFSKAPWGARVVGDETSSPNPSFVGRAIQDIAFDHNRLLILSDGTGTWSKMNNPYVLFKDTVQTVLDTDPVDYKIRGGTKRNSAPLRKIVQAGEATLIWAQKAQYRVTSGADPFRQNTVEALAASSYEFAERAEPHAVGTSLYLPTEAGAYCRIRDLFLRDGKAQGDSDITSHVGRLIPAGVRSISSADSLGMLLVFSEMAPSRLYAYNWLFSDNQRVQSAWNIWRLPAGCTTLWSTSFRSYVYALVHRAEGAALLRLDLSPDLTDPGGDYQTRLDFRISQARLASAVSYNAGTNTSTLALPWTPSELDANPRAILVGVAADATNATSSFVRGAAPEVLGRSGSSIIVRGDLRSIPLYVGFRISAEREESEFYLRGEEGTQPTDLLMVEQYVPVHAKTAYYRAEVTYADGRKMSYEFVGGTLGSPATLTDKVILANGNLTVPITSANNNFRVRLINDSFLPSAWQTAEWRYNAALRAVPRRN
ncbi:MAG: hypothetical protein AB1698_01680 [Pseudomonadota bacterium]